jgi:hypothetical protein
LIRIAAANFTVALAEGIVGGVSIGAGLPELRPDHEALVTFLSEHLAPGGQPLAPPVVTRPVFFHGSNAADVPRPFLPRIPLSTHAFTQ